MERFALVSHISSYKLFDIYGCIKWCIVSIEVYGTVCQLCGIRGIIPVCNFLVFISSSGLIFRIPAIQNIDYSVNFFCTAYLSFCCFDNRIASFIVFRINLCVVRLTRVFYPEFCGKYTFTFYTQRTVYVIWICSSIVT